MCIQCRRRVFKSGPAREIIECRRQERGESTTGGLHLSLGRLEGLPRENLEVLVLICALWWVFMHLGPDFSHDFFARKDSSWRVRKPNAK